MNKIILWVLGAVAVAALIIGSVALVGGNQSVPQPVFGGSTSDNWSVGGNLSVTGTSVFTGRLTTDGGILRSSTNSTTTTATSYTLIQADLLNYSSMLITPNTGDLTLTLPASSTLTSLVPSTGDVATIKIVNASTTAGIDITIAGGTGTLLRKATTTATILSNSVGTIEFVRKANTDIIADFTNSVQ